MSWQHHIEISIIAENDENGDRYTSRGPVEYGRGLSEATNESVFDLAYELLKRELTPAAWATRVYEGPSGPLDFETGERIDGKTGS